MVLNVVSLVLNPKAKFYETLKNVWSRDYVDHHWAEDSIVLERNSRDFVSRIARINANAEAICEVLLAHPQGKCRLLVNSATIVDVSHSETGKLPEI